LLRSEADAEDAFQATFLALARSAARGRGVRSVGGWLHGVAVRVAWKARRAAGRRVLRERAGAVGEADPGGPSAAGWEAAYTALHEEVGRLPAAMRTAFVLCGLGDRPLREAAVDLGRTPGAVAGLLARARSRLVARLTDRGVLAGVAGVAVAGSAGRGVSAGLARKAVGLGSAAEVSAAVSQLAQGVTGMAIHKAKVFALGLVAAGGLAAGLFAQPPGPGSSGSAFLGGSRGQAGNDPKAAVERAKADLAQAQAHYEAVVRAAERAARRAKFEYEPLLTPPTAAQFEAAVAARETDGWEYVGTQEMTLTADDFESPKWRDHFGPKGKRATVLVFRRAAGGVHGVDGLRFNPTGGVHGLSFDRFGGGPAAK
ncbi:MAG: RNA polymerase sigma factor, partial [Gemmataceae bacterium]|nr:RNA polymerase sigma factor [Gemmataceae bacterium]